MANILTNSLADIVGITRAVLYRTFHERNWSRNQPMFNVVEVKDGKLATFDRFLEQAQGISGKLNSPVSLGPYKNAETRIYIYVTHYASTWAFLGVMFRLTATFVTMKRSAAIQKTIWTYCEPTNGPGLSELKNVLVVGIQGDPGSFRELLRRANTDPAATTQSIKDVRGKSLGTYFVLPDTPEIETLLEEFRSQGGDLVVYQVATFEA